MKSALITDLPSKADNWTDFLLASKMIFVWKLPTFEQNHKLINVLKRFGHHVIVQVRLQYFLK